MKRTPLRQAGQSGEEKRNALLEDIVLPYVLGPLLAVLFAFVEWWRYWRGDVFHPWVYTIVAMLALIVGVWKVFPVIRTLRDYRLGCDGERVVAERLEELRPFGFRPLHDIIAGNFNLDHVLIGPSGIFAIETKTMRKRGGSDEKVKFDGEQLFVAGRPLPRDPVAQAQANASWLRDRLRESTGRSFAVTPLVILPGWYVVPPVAMRDTLVLNDHPNGLRAYLVEQPERLSAEDIALAHDRLSLFVRSSAT